MKTKAEIVLDWLPRYTGRAVDQFGKYILLTNFANYVELFAEKFGAEVLGRDRPMTSATAEDITILNFGMGSAMAATVMDLLSAIDPKGVLFLGKCGGLKQTKVGDFLLPIAAIRGEGTSNDYLAQCQRPSRSTNSTTGPGPFTRLTGACGSTMKASNAICATFAPAPSTWKRRRFTWWVS
jgi:nucleoside phosphorylase